LSSLSQRHEGPSTPLQVASCGFMDCAFDQRNSHKPAPLLAIVCWVCISVELKRRMSSTSDHSDLSSFSVHSDDDDSSLEREESETPLSCCSSYWICFVTKKKRVKIPSARGGMKKRTRRMRDDNTYEQCMHNTHIAGSVSNGIVSIRSNSSSTDVVWQLRPQNWKTGIASSISGKTPSFLACHTRARKATLNPASLGVWAAVPPAQSERACASSSRIFF
jgi:hypothetical protein